MLVELGEFAVPIEAEFAPARAVREDTEKRLPRFPLLWRGLAIDFVFAVVYPEQFKRIPESRAKDKLASCDSLEFERLYRREQTGTSESRPGHVSGTRQRRSVATLAEYLHHLWIGSAKSGSVKETVSKASSPIGQARDMLRPESQSHPFSAVDGDPESTTALVWLNAVLFQELLAEHRDASHLPRALRDIRIPKPDPEGRPTVLLGQWKTILRVNW